MGEVRKSLTLEYVKENMQLFPLLAIAFYSVGFIRLKGYYQTFGIQIENYVNINDLIFQSIYIFLLMLILLFLFFLFIKIFEFFTKNVKIENKVIWFILFIQIILLITYFISSVKNLDGSQYLIYAMMVLFFYLIYYEKDYEGFLNYYKLKSIVVILFLSLFFLIGVFGHGVRDGMAVRQRKKNNNVSFEYKGELYSTLHPSLHLIGETSEYIFLFNKVSNRSLVFRKEGINNIQFILKR